MSDPKTTQMGRGLSRWRGAFSEPAGATHLIEIAFDDIDERDRMFDLIEALLYQELPGFSGLLAARSDDLLRRNPQISREEVDAFLKEKAEQDVQSGGGWPSPFGGRRRRTGSANTWGEMIRRQPSNQRRQV